jgi:hypothetical protein
MIKYSHIWLNLPRGDTHFFYIFHLDESPLWFQNKTKKKKKQKNSLKKKKKKPWLLMLG